MTFPHLSVFSYSCLAYCLFLRLMFLYSQPCLNEIAPCKMNKVLFTWTELNTLSKKMCILQPVLRENVNPATRQKKRLIFQRKAHVDSFSQNVGKALIGLQKVSQTPIGPNDPMWQSCDYYELPFYFPVCQYFFEDLPFFLQKCMSKAKNSYYSHKEYA